MYRDLYAANYKMPRKEVKGALNSEETYHVHTDRTK